MPPASIQKYSLSCDEMALVFSMLNMPEVSKSILFAAYPDAHETGLEQKLFTASHSLLARGYARISDKATAVLDDQIVELFTPLGRHKNMLQLALNTSRDESGLSVIHIYIGRNGHFTSRSIELGVVYHLHTGKMEDLPGLILEWLAMPAEITAELDAGLRAAKLTMKMLTLAEFEEKGPRETGKILRELGYPTLIAEALAQDACAPLRRANLAVMNINSETSASAGPDVTGEGFFTLSGKKSSWLFPFQVGEDQMVADVLPGTAAQTKTLLEGIVSRIK